MSDLLAKGQKIDQDHTAFEIIRDDFNNLCKLHFGTLSLQDYRTKLESIITKFNDWKQTVNAENMKDVIVEIEEKISEEKKNEQKFKLYEEIQDELDIIEAKYPKTEIYYSNFLPLFKSHFASMEKKIDDFNKEVDDENRWFEVKSSLNKKIAEYHPKTIIVNKDLQLELPEIFDFFPKISDIRAYPQYTYEILRYVKGQREEFSKLLEESIAEYNEIIILNSSDNVIEEFIEKYKPCDERSSIIDKEFLSQCINVKELLLDSIYIFPLIINEITKIIETFRRILHKFDYHYQNFDEGSSQKMFLDKVRTNVVNFIAKVEKKISNVKDDEARQEDGEARQEDGEARQEEPPLQLIDFKAPVLPINCLTKNGKSKSDAKKKLANVFKEYSNIYTYLQGNLDTIKLSKLDIIQKSLREKFQELNTTTYYAPNVLQLANEFVKNIEKIYMQKKSKDRIVSMNDGSSINQPSQDQDATNVEILQPYDYLKKFFKEVNDDLNAFRQSDLKNRKSKLKSNQRKLLKNWRNIKQSIVGHPNFLEIGQSFVNSIVTIYEIENEKLKSYGGGQKKTRKNKKKTRRTKRRA